ncbi:DUF4190 domain-containing protein [Streptomyces sp. MMS20-AI2-20]|uniref:DUF4190 domain-containing protein n=1 Tax=Streptomyces sp. MMS20-AI2-20 TaxID=2925835 RepID=UPI001F60ED2C|nr:DUF4190 domain-containing protein [Streptomyces sp. MMS20-AI2-20]MCI4141068.1 hypothetical protein [Streptomyces sp. MMS20-AI2-20]
MSDDAPAPGAGDRTGDATPSGGSSTPEVWPAPADGGAPHVAPQDGSLVDARTTETGGAAAAAAPGGARGAAGTAAAGTPPADPWVLPGDPRRPPAVRVRPWWPGSPRRGRRPPCTTGRLSGASAVHEQQTVTSFPAASNTAPPSAAPVAGPYGGAWAGPSGAAVPPPPIGPEGPGQVPYGYPHAGYAGAPAPGYPGGWAGAAAPLPSNGMGVASLVLGIIAAAAFCLWPVAVVLGLLAVIFGAIGRGKANRGEATNGGQALAGVICGAVGSALALAFGIIVLVT